MNTSATGVTGSGDSWTRFMKLAQEARTRNSGLSKVSRNSSVESAFPSTTTSRSSSTYKSSFSTGAPDVKRRILGGQFDSYA
jgi:hypothetical protein